MRISEARALAEILNRQHETVDTGVLEAVLPRLDAYARGAPWDEADAALVWTSPAARQAYLAARRAVLAEIEDRWSDLHFGREFFRRAADDGDADALVLGDAGVTIRILRASGSGDWLINVTLSPDALGLIPAGTRIRLADSGGLTWLTGTPDRDGGVDAFWEERDNPLARLREHRLTLGFL